jgi:hypothetical protein
MLIKDAMGDLLIKERWCVNQSRQNSPSLRIHIARAKTQSRTSLPIRTTLCDGHDWKADHYIAAPYTQINKAR